MTTEALAADERAKNHHLVADRLQRALSNVPVTPPPLTTSASIGVGSGREAIIEVQARARLADLLLPLPAQESGKQLIEEHAAPTSFEPMATNLGIQCFYPVHQETGRRLMPRESPRRLDCPFSSSGMMP